MQGVPFAYATPHHVRAAAVRRCLVRSRLDRFRTLSRCCRTRPPCRLSRRSGMVLLLLLSLAAPAPSGAAAIAMRSDDPPVKVWLDQGNYRRGDKVHVSVKLGEDGYLVVLRVNANGRV